MHFLVLASSPGASCNRAPLEKKKQMTEEIIVDGDSRMTVEEAQHILGKTVSKVIAREIFLEVWLDDGSCLRAAGSSYGGALDVEVSMPDDSAKKTCAGLE